MEQAVYQAAIVTFEELGFMFPAPCADGEPEIGADESVGVAVDFAGEALSGTLFLRVERKVLPHIASNMLGDDSPHGEEMLHDVLGEIANVICGNALPAVGGKTAVFNLAAPRITEKTSVAEKPADVTAKLDLEEGRADVLLYIN